MSTHERVMIAIKATAWILLILAISAGLSLCISRWIHTESVKIILNVMRLTLTIIASYIAISSHLRELRSPS